MKNHEGSKSQFGPLAAVYSKPPSSAPVTEYVAWAETEPLTDADADAYTDLV